MADEREGSGVYNGPTCMYHYSRTQFDGPQASRLPAAAAAVGLLMHFGHIATATLDTLPTRISVVTINPITSGGGLITPAPPRRCCTLREHPTNPPWGSFACNLAS